MTPIVSINGRCSFVLNSFQFMKSLVSTNLLMRQDHFLCSGVELSKTLAPTREFSFAPSNIHVPFARWRQHTILAALQLGSSASTEWVNHLVHIGGRLEYRGNVYLRTSSLPGCDCRDWFPPTGVVRVSCQLFR